MNMIRVDESKPEVTDTQQMHTQMLNNQQTRKILPC